MTHDQLTQMIKAELDEVIEIRHDLHAHPQIGYEETYASGRVQHHLKRLDVPHQAGLAKTGVVGWIIPPNVDSHQAVALRADMDALPIQEETNLPWSSKHDGYMHACGHDGHTAILLGAASILWKLKDQLSRPVKLVFQPAEEGYAGGQKMVETGVLQKRVGGLEVASIFGLHGFPLIEIGQMTSRPQALMAAADKLEISVVGKGGHAAAPHLCVDPIVAAAAIISALQTLASRNVEPTDATVVTISSIHAGDTYNVLPDVVHMLGTIRSLSDATAKLVHRRIQEIAERTAAAHGCKADVDIAIGYPVTYNDPAATDYAMEVGRSVLGEDKVYELAAPVMGGEDFSFYGKHVPASFSFIGLRPKGWASYPGLHTSMFDFPDDALAIGIHLMCSWALGGGVDRGQNDGEQG